MAKGRTAKLDYGALRRELREKGPAGLYLLWGPEDYLQETFLAELRAVCLPGGENTFDHKRLEGPQADPEQLAQALEALPFYGGRVLVELRGFDVNKCREEAAGRITSLLGDIPACCTVAVTLPAGVEPDGRLSLVKQMKKVGRTVEFTAQEQDQLVRWIARRFESLGRSIGRREAERLVFLSGNLMNRLIPEIEKVAAYAKGEAVTLADVDAVAHRLPEADVFEMTDKLSLGDFDGCALILAELLAGKENPIALLSILGGQIRRLFAARLALDMGLGSAFVKELFDIRYDFIANRLLDGAKRFSRQRLADAVALCAETDYRMKSSAEDDEELVKELLLRIAAGGAS
jgi:DNA polymerase-3 subunit delta